MSGRLFAVDVETTGLSPERHFAWDIAAAAEDGTERQWFVRPDLRTADPFALRIGRYYERTASLLPPLSRKQGPKWSDPAKAAMEIACLLDGAVLLGHNPQFDAAMIGAFLHRQGHVLTADHHQVDTGTLVTGFMAGLRRGFQDTAAGTRTSATAALLDARYPLPKGRHLADMARAVGVDPDAYEAHTALGDARLALAVYRAVMGGKA